ncbi:hypothetical protein AX15_005880 [Amanita polypyramis BW_CC]|nr:hypothetical protein AX15_005880 [Amanita polypyramis BW_CC]
MRVLPLCCVIFIASLLCDYTLADSRTSPPSGAVVVRAGTTGEGEYSTITAALNSLPNDNSSCSIFIYPGTYKEQLFISRPGGLTIYGYTTRIETYTENVVIIQHNLSSAQAGSDDASGTLRIYKDNFAMYNVNVKNTHGFGSPAIAVSQYGNRVGFYACGLYGYQDTLLAEYGTQVYLQGYIEGAVDFIFGQTALAYFGGNTIAVSAAGFITASGRASDDLGSYVFNQNTIILASNAASNTGGNVYLGRPWRGYAK